TAGPTGERGCPRAVAAMVAPPGPARSDGLVGATSPDGRGSGAGDHSAGLDHLASLRLAVGVPAGGWRRRVRHGAPGCVARGALPRRADRKSTRLNSSHLVISYAVF